MIPAKAEYFASIDYSWVELNHPLNSSTDISWDNECKHLDHGDKVHDDH